MQGNGMSGNACPSGTKKPIRFRGKCPYIVCGLPGARDGSGSSIRFQGATDSRKHESEVPGEAPMFIRQFEVSNYKIHKATTVNLYPITVFVGSNNGGKSALFDSILNFSMVSRGKLSQ